MKLGLGTAQFGMSYGISNTGSKTSPAEVVKILDAASKAGVRILDTAPAYGDSQQVLGRAFPQINATFDVVSKTPTTDALRMVRGSVLRSLEALGQNRLYGLLLHRVSDLFQPGADALIRELQDLVRQGLLQKLGVSVYSSQEIDQVLSVFKPEIVQCPINVFDQRLLHSGHLQRLHTQGIEIHARSIFLQGLLLMNPETLDPYFSRLIPHFQKYVQFMREAGLRPVEAALAFIAQQPFIDTALVGVCSSQEFADIQMAWETNRFRRLDMSAFAFFDDDILNPSQWARRI